MKLLKIQILTNFLIAAIKIFSVKISWDLIKYYQKIKLNKNSQTSCHASGNWNGNSFANTNRSKKSNYRQFKCTINIMSKVVFFFHSNITWNMTFIASYFYIIPFSILMMHNYFHWCDSCDNNLIVICVWPCNTIINYNNIRDRWIM